MDYSKFYSGKKVFLTGHTGFKGSWLCLWLEKMGAEVTSYALEPSSTPNHFSKLDLKTKSYIDDLRNAQNLEQALVAAKPDVVFHLGAQAIVKDSYDDPVFTYETNVMGTLYLLQACRKSSSVKSVVVVTSDKCYQNDETGRAFIETDALGGHDMYSSSKACAELLSRSFQKSFLDLEKSPAFLMATARAGNVIGGGDWSNYRLVPDLARSCAQDEPVVIRSPQSYRPWQHVLEPLSGYLELGQRLFEGDLQSVGAWNFGPEPSDILTVQEILDIWKKYWPQLNVHYQPDHFHEAKKLMLSIEKSKTQLNWKPKWNAEEAIEHTVKWYRLFYEKSEICSRSQIAAFNSEV